MNFETCSRHEKLKIVNSFIHGDRNLPALNSTKYLKPIVGSRIVVKTPEGDITVKVLKEIKTEIFYSYQEKWVEEMYQRITTPLREIELANKLSFEVVCKLFESAHNLYSALDDLVEYCKGELNLKSTNFKKLLMKFLASKIL